MASRWAEYKENADIMPYLQYETVGDNNVRDEHALLDGVVRKITDSFWATHYPPNGWGCRCSAIQLPVSHAKETKIIPRVPVPQMFRTNLADAGLIFPKNHSYYNGIPKNKLIEAMVYLPDDNAYKVVYTAKNGGVLKQHILHGSGNPGEVASNTKIAKKLLDDGVAKEIKLLPDFGGNSEHHDYLREKVYGTKKFISGKNPDALIDGEVFEFKHLKSVTRKRIQKDIDKARKQSSNVMFSSDIKFNEKDINSAVGGIIKQSKSIKQIWYYYEDVLTKKPNPNYKK